MNKYATCHCTNPSRREWKCAIFSTYEDCIFYSMYYGMDHRHLIIKVPWLFSSFSFTMKIFLKYKLFPRRNCLDSAFV